MRNRYHIDSGAHCCRSLVLLDVRCIVMLIMPGASEPDLLIYVLTSVISRRIHHHGGSTHPVRNFFSLSPSFSGLTRMLRLPSPRVHHTPCPSPMSVILFSICSLPTRTSNQHPLERPSGIRSSPQGSLAQMLPLSSLDQRTLTATISPHERSTASSDMKALVLSSVPVSTSGPFACPYTRQATKHSVYYAFCFASLLVASLLADWRLLTFVIVTLEAYIDKYTSLVPYIADNASGTPPSDAPPPEQTSKAISLQVRSLMHTPLSSLTQSSPLDCRCIRCCPNRQEVRCDTRRRWLHAISSWNSRQS
jgi:hypothetical protein